MPTTNQEDVKAEKRNRPSNTYPSSLQGALSSTMGCWAWEGSCSCLWSLCSPASVCSVGEHLLPGQDHLPDQELHYASLQRLPILGSDQVEGEAEGMKEDHSTDYACIAKNKPT
uniref:Uncharacterized protein n=1 Tax=Marmota marmota marmota TaxID=9994 RepID=A0A8C5Z9V9_MARMA